jgi:hypothetical protein
MCEPAAMLVPVTVAPTAVAVSAGVTLVIVFELDVV